MKIVGVIAEFNPFHNGHAYFLKEAKKKAGASHCIVVMSGDFVQRGVPAVLDKYVRTRAALANGADLVLELPVYYASSSAETFALGAVSMLHRLGVTSGLAFGCETPDYPLLQEIADLLFAEPPSYRFLLRQLISRGMTYPAARSKALTACFPGQEDALSAVLSQPNNILAISYLKALRVLDSSLSPVPVARKGAGFHSLDRKPPFASATALRSMIFSEAAPCKKESWPHTFFKTLSGYIPSTAIAAMESAEYGFCPVREDMLSAHLHFCLQNLADKGDSFAPFLDVGEELGNRISNHLFQYTTFTGFSNLCKTKEMTRSRVNRGLLHILLGIRQEHLESARALGHTPYARILGCRKEAVPLLSSLKKNTTLKLITKPSNALSLLTEKEAVLWNLDLHAANLYQMLLSDCYGIPMQHEYKRAIQGLAT